MPIIFTSSGESISSQVWFLTKRLSSSLMASLYLWCKHASLNYLKVFRKGLVVEKIDLECSILAQVSIWWTLNIAGGKTISIEGLC